MCFYGAYNYSGLVRQVSRFSNVVSVRRVHVVLWTAGFKGGGKPCRKTRETAALRRGIQETSRTSEMAWFYDDVIKTEE